MARLLLVALALCALSSASAIMHDPLFIDDGLPRLKGEPLTTGFEAGITAAFHQRAEERHAIRHGHHKVRRDVGAAVPEVGPAQAAVRTATGVARDGFDASVNLAKGGLGLGLGFLNAGLGVGQNVLGAGVNAVHGAAGALNVPVGRPLAAPAL